MFLMFLSLISFGYIDCLPDAHRPWLVDLFPDRPVGRGKTLWEALLGNLRGRNL